MSFKKFLLYLSVLCIFATACFSEEFIPAEDFSLKDTDGNIISLADYKGKVVFIDFWATWCPPCRQSIPYVEKLYQKYKDNDNFVILGINAGEAKNDVAKFIEKQNMNYPVLLGTNAVLKNYSVRGIPAFFIIDQQGNIYNKYIGFTADTYNLWIKDIKKILD